MVEVDVPFRSAYLSIVQGQFVEKATRFVDRRMSGALIIRKKAE